MIPDPLSMPPNKAIEAIGNSLQKAYERWQPRARYKQSLDPTVEEVKKLCMSLRRNAKEERVLFHYNGHGVPKPTTNGEIWVFNKVRISLQYKVATEIGRMATLARNVIPGPLVRLKIALSYCRYV